MERSELEARAAEEMLAFAEFFDAPGNCRPEGAFTIQELAKQFGVCRMTALARLRKGIEAGKIEVLFGVVESQRTKFYRIKKDG